MGSLQCDCLLVFGGLTSCYDGIALLSYRLLESTFLIGDALASCIGNNDTPVTLSGPVVEELNTFAMSTFHWNGRSVLPPLRLRLCIGTDASDTGRGAVILCAHCAYRFTCTSDSWTVLQKEPHLNSQESFAATEKTNALLKANSIRDTVLLVQVDSKVVYAYLRKHNKVILRWLAWCVRFSSTQQAYVLRL